MRPDAYAKQMELSDRHWWWRGRRKILAALLDRMDIPDGADILEIGCGDGSNLPILTQYGSVYASDVDADMLAVAASRYVATVAPGSFGAHVTTSVPHQTKCPHSLTAFHCLITDVRRR